MTDLEWARELASWSDYDDRVKAVANALAQAHAEGRADALREALRVDGRCYDDCVYAQRIRSLIPAGQPSGDAKGTR